MSHNRMPCRTPRRRSKKATSHHDGRHRRHNKRILDGELVTAALAKRDAAYDDGQVN